MLGGGGRKENYGYESQLQYRPATERSVLFAGMRFPGIL